MTKEKEAKKVYSIRLTKDDYDLIKKEYKSLTVFVEAMLTIIKIIRATKGK